jgi:Holliday junction DNA helicase RuvA
MIGRLEGHLHRVDPGMVLIDVGGVSYRVAITLRAFQELGDRETAAMWIHTQVRDDAIVLFGFLDAGDLEAFERLISVAGVGPRTALSVLSGLTADELAQAVENADVARLQRTPGVGRKTADRIILELKGRLSVSSADAGDRRGDAVSALVNLGYGQRDATKAIAAVWSEALDEDLGELLRLALQKLVR